MVTDFNKYAARGNEVLAMLAEELEIPRNKAYRILRAVLHALRNRLGMQESLQVMAQLPVALKGLYVDQWKGPQKMTRIHHLSQFLDEVRKCDGGLAGYDFGNDEMAGKAVKAVFRTLNYYLSEGEFEDIIAVFPAEIKEFIRNALSFGKMPL